MIPGKGTHTIGPILLTWEWDEELNTVDNVTLQTAGVMSNDQARELGIMLVGLTVSDERLPVEPSLSAYHTKHREEQ